MARHLDRVETREGLKPRREPYWHRLAEGRHIGFRKQTRGSPGNWIARFYDGEEYKQKPLGDFIPMSPKERFGAARAAAEEWFEHLDKGGSTKRLTVKAACEAYTEKTRLEKSEAAAKDREGRFARLVNDDAIGKVDLSKLTARHIAEWKKRVLARGGARSSFNRNIAVLQAALNLAYRRKDVASNHAWADELKPLENAESRRTLYLARTARRKLIEKAPVEVRPFLTALALVPMRPGELAKLRVQDLDVKNRALHIPSGKTGARDIPLASEALSHFKTCSKSKLPGAWLVARADGSKWDRFSWRDAIREAVKAGKLPKATCAYTLRHSAITDLITGGLDLFTLAKISGTSIAMIEKHYGHLQREHARDALEGLALI